MNLETPRLILRDLIEGDFEALHAYGSDPEATLFMDWGPNTPEQTREFLDFSIASQTASPRKIFNFGIVLKENQQLIGGIGFEVQSFQNRSGSFGYILRKDFWGLGIATEAGKAVTSFALKQLNLHRLWATCRPENGASKRVLEKLGFEKEGYLRHDKFIRGEFKDSLLFSLIQFN